ncbi:MAG TPA: lipid-A-disaccharide synthase, partial [Gammaproteobacteria bacterium]
GIDSPDFNLPVEAAVRKAGITSVQYVSPQVWAWRQSRVRSIRESTDLVLCLLPFETAFYEQHGVPAVFVGHPLADEIALEVDAKSARTDLGVGPGDKVLALLPGSRTSEVTRLARPFAETAAWLQHRHPGLRILAAITNDKLRKTFLDRTRDIALDPPVQSVIGDARSVMAASDVVLTASGTASLEIALHKRPMVVAYIISGLTHRLLRFMGLNELEYFSLPNLLAGRGCVAEYLQRDVRADVLGPALERYLEPGSEVEDLRETFLSLHSTLRRNASQRAASAIADVIYGVSLDR